MYMSRSASLICRSVFMFLTAMAFVFFNNLLSSIVSVFNLLKNQCLSLRQVWLWGDLTQLDLANPSCLYFPRVWRHVRSGLIFVVFPWELSSQWWRVEQDSSLKYTWPSSASLGAFWWQVYQTSPWPQRSIYITESLRERIPHSTTKIECSNSVWPLINNW